MPGGELEPIVRSSPALAEVAAEMTEIFEQAGVGQPAPGVRRSSTVAALRPSRGAGPGATLMIAAAAGLVGLGAGAFVIRTPSPSAQTAGKSASQPARPQAPVTPPIALAQAAPAPAVEFAPAAEPKAARSPPAATPATAAAKSRARFRAKLARLGDARPASTRGVVRAAEPTPMAQPASCEQDSAGDECRRAVVLADRHLRAVYERAIQRGVSRSTLVDYRDRWADLRDRDTENPTRLIESYGALAYDLGRETAGSNDPDDGPRPRGRSGLRALADLLLPWR
jgi:hypothetical protein